MEPITLWKRLKKHYLLVLTGLFGLMLLLFFGIYQAFYSAGATPIAHISPEDSVKTTLLPGKLERYKKELLEEEKAAYKRKLALDEIVSMDFSRKMKADEARRLTDTVPLHPLPEEAPQGEVVKKAQLSKPAKTKKQIQRKTEKTSQSTGEIKADEGFYTIKTGTHTIEVQGQKASAPTFVRALIHGNQKVKIGGIVCLRLAEKAAFDSHTYPVNTIFYGRIKSGSAGRVQILISQVKQKRVSLSVYDQDYMEGIPYQMKEVAGEIARESREEALNEVLSSLPYGGVAGGLAQLGRNIGRKAKQPASIYLADGYEIFIAPAR
jgi:hypothetical protein